MFQSSLKCRQREATYELKLFTTFSDVPPNTTEMPTSGNAVSKVRALKQPATRQMSQLPKSQGNGKIGLIELHC